MKRNVTAVACAVAALLVPVVSGCGSKSSSGDRAAPPSTTAPPASASPAAPDKPVAAAQPIVMTRVVGKLGTVLVDGKGRTLYLFAADTSAKSTCTGACAVTWPPLPTAAGAKAGGGAKANLLGTTKRSGGANQVTYNKHPLYYYAGDTKPGQANGQGLNQFGGLWWVVNPAGDKVTR
jgi:predicted lipoprotein with Yx(FWY)xxD motif